MASINEINFVDILNINGVNISTGGSAIDFTSWVVGTRPDGTSLSEGDFAVDTTHGRGYRWDDTVGALLPIDVYGETFDLTARVNGDEADASELSTFIEFDAGTSTTAYNGTNLTLEGGNNSNQVSLRIDETLGNAAIDNTKNLYWRVVCARGTSTSAVAFGFLFRDGSHELNMRNWDTSPFRRLYASNYNLAIGTSLTDDAPFKTGDTNTHVIEMYVKRDSDEDAAYVIVDGKVYHCSDFQNPSGTASNKITQMFTRGFGSGDNCDMVVYESTFCVW